MNRKSQVIAILGATGHIAKSIIYSFKDEPNFALHLFTRSEAKTKAFAKEIKLQNAFVHSYQEFNEFDYSSIISCVGIGDPSRLRSYPDEVFFVSEEIDLLVIKYLINHQQTTYINFSSGAVYGTEFNTPANDNSSTEITINELVLSDFYGIAKINAEAKHRSLRNYNIIDLRIFGFYSKFIDLQRPFFLSEVVSSLKTKKPFLTSNSCIIRDYIHPNDLALLVKRCMEYKNINAAFDVCSKKPISKLEILDYFNSNYNLKYEVVRDLTNSSVTGNKDNYFSESKKINEIEFEAQYTSLESINFVTNEIFKQS
jgi:nucleoside-diphosphate-sugar epimerase